MYGRESGCFGRVRPRDFMPGDLILRKVVGSMKDQNAEKLAPIVKDFIK